MSLLRLAARRARAAPLACLYLPPTSRPPLRTYAKRAPKDAPAAPLVPGSQQRLTDPAALREHAATSEKMAAAAEWFRRACAAREARAAGRVTPAVLDPVRVLLPGAESAVRLDAVATVGVREGAMLLVTVFDEKTTKFIEAAIYDAKIPGVVPHKHDVRTIKIPIPKPTVEARTAIYNEAHLQAEETRVQIRKLHQAALKRGKYAKHSIELEEFQKLTDRYVGEVDKVIADLKKATGVSKK